jgi:hypothetical protein
MIDLPDMSLLTTSHLGGLHTVFTLLGLPKVDAGMLIVPIEGNTETILTLDGADGVASMLNMNEQDLYISIDAIWYRRRNYEWIDD